MTTKERRELILEILNDNENAISASFLAKKCFVTRQVIVGDIALLRAQGNNIVATPRGYILSVSQTSNYTVACCHSKDELMDELYTIVDCGCGIIDVIVEHPVYGQIAGNLHIFSRADVDQFIKRMNECDAYPLCSITKDTHLHTVTCPSEKHYDQLCQALASKNYLI